MKYSQIKRYHTIKREIFEVMGREPSESELDDAIADDKVLNNLYRARDFENFEIDGEAEKEVELKFKMGVSNMNLVKARIAKGLDQTKVDELLAFKRARYGTIERCMIYPTEDEQSKIASLFGKSTQHLFPEWLNVFTDRWKESEREKTVKLRAESLSSPEVAGLIAAPSSMQKDVEVELLKAKLTPMLNSLNARERKILEMRFGLVDGVGHTLEEVGKEFDVTRERIRHIEALAIEKLYQQPGVNHLREFLDNPK